MNYARAFYFLYALSRSAYWDADKLARHQNKKLKHIVKYAYDRVPFYHNMLRRLGLHPDDIERPADLNKLPIIRRNEIARNPLAFISSDFDITRLKRLSTSGSTGQPLFLYINQAEDEFRKAKHLRANISCGQRIRDKWVVITSPSHFGSSTKLQRVARVYTPTPVSVFNDVGTQVSIIEKLDPDILDGYSSSLYLLAKDVNERRLTNIRPRFIIGGGELVDENSRRFVENVFEASFYDHYLCEELDSISWQCTKRVGYHIDADSIIVETVDDQGNVSIDESGEIVCTSLFNYAMPLIRYSVGDVGRLSSEECTCGRHLPLMKMIEGRSDSLLIMPDGKILSPRTFTVAVSRFKRYELFDQFRITQKRTDSFELCIKLREQVCDEDALRNEIVRHLARTLGLSSDTVSFEVKFVDDIPIDKTGKLRMVVSELPKNAR